LSIIVQKFGGTSMGDPGRIGRAADRIVAARQQGHDVVAVVSAMGETTDQLLALADRVTAERCDRERDMLVTAGERIAMALLCMSLQARGCQSISFTGSQAGILTNDRHQNARIIEVRPVRVQDELARGKVVVVAGYQGMSYKREITTLGRGGSDTTAIALAAALGAEAVEMYSDVDGVYSADPRDVPGAVRLDEVDADVMAALARGGARVLAADAVAYARAHGIALFCRATDPSDGAGQTLVRRFGPGDERTFSVTAVSGRDEGVSLRSAAIADAEPLLDELADADLLLAVAGARELTVVGEGVDGEPVGLVTLAGMQLDRDPALVQTLYRAALAAGAAPRALSVSSNAITAAVRPEQVDPLVRELHRIWIEDA